LPFLRFTRDKRGYETTALVYAPRQRGRARERILYWFRTPPGVKVGRPALDEEAIRWIEEHNPDIEFDWPKILQAQPPPAPLPDDGRNRRPRGKSERPGREARAGRDGTRRDNRRPQDQVPPPVPAVQPPPLSAIGVGEPTSSELEGIDTSFSEEALAIEDGRAEDGLANDMPHDMPADDMPAIDALEHITHPDTEEILPAAGPPIESIVGKEQLTRLRARYAELQARITERGGEAARVEELRAKAETLNPDTWVTREEARAGLKEFDTKIRDLRLALGLRPRRRSRRGGRRRRRAGQANERTQPGALPSDQPEAASDQPSGLDGPAESPETSNSEDFSD
jgi:hypothetical protein